MIKAPKKLEIDELYLNITRAKVYDKSMTNIILNGNKTVIVFSKIWNKTKVCTSPFLFNLVPDVLAGAI